MAITFFACGKKEMTDEQRIVGNWEAKMSMKDMLMSGEETLDEETQQILQVDKLTSELIFKMEFKSNGEYIIDFDQNSVDEAVAELNKYYAEYVGGELSEEDKLSADDFLGEAEGGVYEFKDGTLYLDDTETTYSFEGDDSLNLTFEGYALNFVRK